MGCCRCRWVWGTLHVLALGLALALGEGSEEEEEGPPEHFLIQASAECSFFPSPNGSQAEGAPSGVRYIKRYNYGIYAPFARSRRVQPSLQITPIEHETSSGRTVLICDVDGFWPAEIEVKWFRNGKEEEGPQVMTTDLIRNGDWTFQIQVMLETKPQRGDLYACQVEHASFASPARVQWEPQSDSARSKMWTGIAGILLGLVFLAPGLLLYLKNRKGDVLPQSPAALMS